LSRINVVKFSSFDYFGQNPLQLTYIRNSEAFLATPVDGEMVLLHRPSGQLLGFNIVASAIWMVLEEKKSFEEIIAFLQEKFEVEEQQCIQETKGILARMIKQKIVLSE